MKVKIPVTSAGPAQPSSTDKPFKKPAASPIQKKKSNPNIPPSVSVSSLDLVVDI